MTEEEAISRLAACKHLIELVEANLQNDSLPPEGASNDQLDHLEQLLEVDPDMYSKAMNRKKAGFSKDQMELLFNQKTFIEPRKIQRSLLGNKE